MGFNTKEIGRIKNLMDLIVDRDTQMVVLIGEVLSMGLRMEKANIVGLMGKHMSETLKMATWMAREF
jgi:hypothetical protein